MTYETTEPDMDQARSDAYVKLQYRTWTPAVPWLLGALAAWALAIWTYTHFLTTILSAESDGSAASQKSQIREQALFQSLNTILIWLGAALFLGGVLTVVLRGHERWKLQVRAAEEELDEADAVAAAAVATGVIAEGPTDVADTRPAPPYAQNNWDDRP